MGCGTSRPDNIEAEAPTVPTPSTPLQSTIDEIKRATARRSTSTLSAKQLLHDDEVGEEEEEHQSREGSLAKVEHSAKDENLRKTDNNNNKMVGAADEEKPKQVHEKEKEGREGEMDHEDEEEDSESTYGDGDGSEVGPGSPSFREYCIIPSANSIDSGNTDIEKRSEKGRRKKCLSVGSVCSEASVAVLVKKEHKQRRSFKRVLPMGSVKKRLIVNVKSCYPTIPCSTPNNDRLAPAATAI